MIGWLLLLGLSCGGVTQEDPRNIANGFRIPDEGYCDQPYIVRTRHGRWVCVMTTGKGNEGERGQHVVSTYSEDQGKTWSPLMDIEPADGPEASWATPLLAPSGRIFVFYDYNGDEIRTLDDKPIRADMLGWYCYRWSDDDGESWSPQRIRIPVRLTAADRGNQWEGKVQVQWGIAKPILLPPSSMLLPFTKLGRYMLDLGEGWFLYSPNLLTEEDPAKVAWELRPEGEHGVRHVDFGSVQEEHNAVLLEDGTLYCVYRTTQGFVAHSRSSDRGRTWTVPEPVRYSSGKIVRNPRACPKLWKLTGSTGDEDEADRPGHYLLWYHNHGGKDFYGRNPAWLIGGVERDGSIEWSQPEILLYDIEPKTRMSYPDLIREPGRYFVTETQKEIARVHEVDPTLIHGLFRQDNPAYAPQDGKESLADLPASCFDLETCRGFSLEFVVPGSGIGDGETLLAALDDEGRGLRLVQGARGTFELTLDDGRETFAWRSDARIVEMGEATHVAVVVDAGPRIVSFIVDGQFSDGTEEGGEDRQFGWGRYEKLGPVVRGPWTVHPHLRVKGYDRPIRISEAVAAYHRSRER